MMDKILCKDCEHLVSGFGYIGCGYNQYKTVFDPVYGSRVKGCFLDPWHDPDYPNKNGECKFYQYKHKWWKFWVKK